MPRISVATPMLLRIDSSRTPNALISVVIDERDERDEHEHRRQAGRIRAVQPRRVVGHRAVDAVDHEGDDDRDRGHRHDLGPEVEPAGEPAERAVRQALRPLVDRAGDREMARQLGEHERDQRLADDDDRPRPEERRAAQPDADAEVAERPVETLMKLNAIAKFDRNPSVRLSSGLMPSDLRWASSFAATSDCMRGPDTASSLYHRDTARLGRGSRDRPLRDHRGRVARRPGPPPERGRSIGVPETRIKAISQRCAAIRLADRSLGVGSV